MKKLGFCLLALSLVGFAVGCGKGETPSAPNTTPPVESGTEGGTDGGGGEEDPAEGEGAAN